VNIGLCGDGRLHIVSKIWTMLPVIYLLLISSSKPTNEAKNVLLALTMISWSYLNVRTLLSRTVCTYWFSHFSC